MPDQNSKAPSYLTLEDAAQFIAGMKFRKKAFGGVDELNVIRQLEQLQMMYATIFENQAAYYKALLDEKDKAIERLAWK